MSTAPPRRGVSLQAGDLRGASRLAVEATLGLTDLVENLHHNIARGSAPLGVASVQPTAGVTGLVYRSIRGVTRLVGGSLDALLGTLVPLLGPAKGAASAEREAVLSALNGVLGDHLEASGNPLAIRMQLRHEGRALPPGTPVPGGRRVLLMVHGLCMNAGQWQHRGHDHGALLAAEGGYMALYANYNTGLPIATNGRRLADRLQALHEAGPIEELVILGHSMGGLVARSACHQALARGDAWTRPLTKLFFLGSPHLGAPLERGGHWVDAILGVSPYTAAFARLSKLRSAGITDLRHGRLLEGRSTDGPPSTVPLPDGVACHAIAGSLGREPGSLQERLLGDGLVPLDSALGHAAQPDRKLRFDLERLWIARGAGHLDLLSDPAVLARLRDWLLPARAAPAVRPRAARSAGTSPAVPRRPSRS